MANEHNRRVVITGIGLVSPLGNNRESLWKSLSTGHSGVARIESLPTEHLPISCAGEARCFQGDIGDFGPLQKDQMRNIRKGLKVMCREIQMGVAAAQLALADAGLAPGAYDCDRSGVVYGSDYILTQPDEFTEGIRQCLTPDHTFDFSRWADEGMPKVTPLWLLKYLPNMPASHIAIYNDLRGPSNSITLREASSNLALAEAFCTIVRGQADTIVAGATGTRLHPMRTVHVAMQEEVATGNEEPAAASRPFDLNRRGMVLGEGSGAVVVEELRTAQARKVAILAEVIGFGSSAVTDRQGVGNIRRAMENVIRQALAKAGLRPDDLGHLHAHGLATRNCDQEEASAIQAVFGERRNPLPIVAAKSYMGNLGAAGGMVETIASILALKDGHLFPILNYETPDPLCPIWPVLSLDYPSGDTFLNLNVTPQGQASAIVIRRFA